jgi:hypothetical protein
MVMQFAPDALAFLFLGGDHPVVDKTTRDAFREVACMRGASHAR